MGQIKRFGLLHGVFVAALGAWFWRQGYRKQPLLALYALIALATTVTTGREGASTNYFIETIAILAVIAGLSLGDVFAAQARAPKALMAGLIVAHLAIFVLPRSPLVALANRHTPEFGLVPRGAAVAGCATLDALIRAAPGPVLVENPGFAVVNNKDVVGNAAILNFLAKKGELAPSLGLIATIERQDYALIAFQGEAYSYEVLHATDRAYRELARVRCIDEYEIKVPAR